MRRVILESPYRAGSTEQQAKHVAYARAALKDSLARGEAPIASHLLYTQPGVLDNENSNERRQGIKAGLAWLDVAEAMVVYMDLDISEGMAAAINRATLDGLPVEYRRLSTGQ